MHLARPSSKEKERERERLPFSTEIRRVDKKRSIAVESWCSCVAMDEIIS
jgi:hypothetical protein